MQNKKVIFFFPSTVFSGHEKMALKILEKAPFSINCILNKELVTKFSLTNFFFSYSNFFSLIKILLKIRFQNNKISVVIVAGSPYGFVLEKALIKLLFFELIDYVPFPELNVMQDRFHHKFLPFINKTLITSRLLIDEWQVEYSAVKRCIVIKNIVEND